MSETTEVPIHILPDGREFITHMDCVEYPWVAEFVGRFSNYWQRDTQRDGYVSP